MKKLILFLLVTSCTSIVSSPSKIALESLAPDLSIPVAPRKVFSSSSDTEWLKLAINKANCVLNNQDFIAEVEAFKDYTFTDKSSPQVANAIKELKPIKVALYKTKNPFSKAIATTYASDRETVYINTRRNPRAMPDMVNTIIHEGLHLAGFSHGDNSPVGKENSVNYKVGSIAEKYVEKCN